VALELELLKREGIKRRNGFLPQTRRPCSDQDAKTSQNRRWEDLGRVLRIRCSPPPPACSSPARAAAAFPPSARNFPAPRELFFLRALLFSAAPSPTKVCRTHFSLVLGLPCYCPPNPSQSCVAGQESVPNPSSLPIPS
jgi:hypothetical protein